MTTQSLERAVRTAKHVEQRVADALLAVPREEFVPESMREYAYDNRALPIGSRQTISQPSLVAVMVSLMNLKPDLTDCVLDVGCGSGYTSAILSKLAARVVAVERIPSLAGECVDRLNRLGFNNVDVVAAPEDTLGYPERAPFDAILVSAGAPVAPDSLCQQLAHGGRMVIPIGDRFDQRLAVVHRGDQLGDFKTDFYQSCHFVPLIGPGAWPAEGD